MAADEVAEGPVQAWFAVEVAEAVAILEVGEVSQGATLTVLAAVGEEGLAMSVEAPPR